jgi:phosphoribosylanthranilate isomerase
VALLWDAAPSPTAHRAGRTGGSGQVIDWHALALLQASGALAGLPPMILAGGLTPANVGEAIATVEPYAVDVSSGVESRPGVKDPARIRAFCAAVQKANEPPAHQCQGHCRSGHR